MAGAEKQEVMKKEEKVGMRQGNRSKVWKKGKEGRRAVRLGRRGREREMGRKGRVGKKRKR
jgi:hypothetical protein